MSGNQKNEEATKEDCKCYVESHTKHSCPAVRNVTHPLRYYELTPEEMKALEECDKESFYQRCLPFSTLFATLTYAAIKNGYLKPNQKFGAFPKVTLAIVVGYFVGKVSYQGACAEKLMALPNSYVGQLLRERRSGITGTSTRFPSKTMLGVTEDDIYSDAGPGNSLDLDTSRPIFSDDSYRPGSELAPNLSPPDEKRPQSPMSYEELRRRNRGENDSRDPYKPKP